MLKVLTLKAIISKTRLTEISRVHKKRLYLHMYEFSNDCLDEGSTDATTLIQQLTILRCKEFEESFS